MLTWPNVRARVTATLSIVRARLTRRVLVRTALAVTTLCLVGMTVEAVSRGHLGSIASRVPSALYTRPLGWGSERDRAPMLLATLGDGPTEYRIPVGREDIPASLVQAVLAVEDQRFERHFGLDLKRIGGAIVANVKAGRISQGGSTLTQQLAKNLFLSHARTPLRKLREAALALAIEARHDKAEILEAYLNEIYLGQDGSRPIHGVGAAARFYFGKSVSRLALAESALLAGLIQAPNRTNPIRHERQARRRRNLVISLMLEQGRTSRKAADQAARARINTRAYPASVLDARHVRDWLRARAPIDAPPRGQAVYTTIDADLQRAALRAVADGARSLGSAEIQAALVAIDPRTGDLLAMVGGRDYSRSQFNRATDARRQPGSAFKPIVALTALEESTNGRPAFTLASRIDDEPLVIKTGAGPWAPSNYDRSFRGEVTLREAIEQSLNVPFVRVGLEIGPARIIATARRLGITSPLAAVPSLALGSSEISLLELVRAYGVFAAGGRLAPLRTVAARGPFGGRVQLADHGPVSQVVDPGAAFLVTSALEGAVQRGTGRAIAGTGPFETIAGKTGTSNDWRDAWFIAFSPSIVVGAWVGYDDGRSLHHTGADAALPIVARFLQRADPEDRWESFQVPDGVEVASTDCFSEEYFLAGTAPDSRCDGAWNWDREDQDDDTADESGTDRHARGRMLQLDRDWHRRLERQAGRAMTRLLERLLDRGDDAR